MSDEIDQVRTELDAAHERIRVALDMRDLTGYLAALHPAVVYQQANGIRIDRSQISRGVRAQFARARLISSHFERNAFELTPEGATETLHQVIVFVSRAFGFIHREWRVTRSGEYSWVFHQHEWRLASVRVNAEESSSRWYLSSRLRPSDNRSDY